MAAPFEGAKPRYLLVAETLANDIKSGKYEVGGLLPTEAELSELFNVSRHTVREATRKLRDLDLVTRLQGIGTRVKNVDIRERYVLELGSFLDMWRLVEETEPTILSRRMISADKASIPLPPIEGGDKWLEIEITRAKPVANGTPIVISYSKNYINGNYASISEKIDTARIPLFSLIADTFNKEIVSVKQDLTAAILDSQKADLLKADLGSAALRIIRTYYGENAEVLEVSEVFSPSDRFNFSTTIRLESVTA